MKSHNPWILACCGLLGTAPALLAEMPVDKSCAASADGGVEVEVVAGTIEISGWNEDRISVTGTAGDEILEVFLDCTPGRSELRTERVKPEGRSAVKKSTTHLVIRIPSGAALEAESVSAAFDIADLTGRVSIESVSGTLEIHGVPAALEIDSVSGSVHVEKAVSPLSIETISGEIVVDAADGKVDVSTISGNLRILGGVVTDLSMESVSGNVEFTGDVGSSGKLRAESHSGAITLHLPASVSAELRVSSFNGSITNRLAGGEKAREGGPGEGKSLRQTLGRGAARIDLETFSGTIELLGE